MMFSQFRIQRLGELMAEPWGDIRIPDLMEVYRVARPRRVLEIGSYRGVSTEFWALSCQFVTSVDPSPDMAVRRELHARLAHYPHVNLVEAESPVKWGGQPFDLVYLDGDHSYITVRDEITTYLPIIERDGWLGGHDYTDTPAPGDGVKQAVDEYIGVPDYRFSDGSWLHPIRKIL